MAGLIGAMTAAALFGEANPALSIDLDALTEAGYAPVYYDPVRPGHAVTTTFRLQDGLGYGRIGRAPAAFGADFYDRVYVSPPRLDLGSVANTQVRQVVVWNAYLDAPVILESTSLVDGDGIAVAAPGVLPLTFAPMQERTWTITVSDQGAPSVNATLGFAFTGLDGLSVRIVGTRINAWVVAADWGQPVDETLAWMTDLQRALNGATTRIPCREAPRRTLEFSLVEGRAERRIIESLIYDWGTRLWALPIWPDVSLLEASLPQGADRIAMATAGLDFAVGSLAMLWMDVRTYELIEVEAIAADELVFSRGTSRAWPKGARVYPCRTARMTDAPMIRRQNDRVITCRVRFEIDEPCAWPAVAPPTTYQGYPVFDTRSDQAEDPSASYSRITVTTDGDVGLVSVDDFSGLVFGRQSHAWKLYGRAERAAHRSLMYWFEGRARAVWLPTWADDVELVEPMTEISEVMVVAWAAISRSLRQQPGRRHLRIELTSGEVFHRRVENSAELDADREQLLLDVALGRAVQPAEVRLICWMALSLQDSDRAEISHVADSHGLAMARTTFIADPGNEP